MYRRNKRFRIMVSLLSSIFVIFSMQMFFQNLSIGNAHTDPDPNPGPSAVPDSSPSTLPTPIVVDPGVKEPTLTKDQQYYQDMASSDSTNVLLMGEDTTSGSYDTIMVMSIDKKSQTIKLINFPRDILIEYSDYVLNEFKAKRPDLYNSPGIFKLNAVPAIGKFIEYKKGTGRFGDPRLDFVSDVINEVFGIYIQDYVYLKVSGLRNIVDYFGGVKINVPILMNYYDPTQDLDIYIEPGYQRLYGKDAEGFLRFRQGYNANGVMKNYGDIFRKENQIAFVKAFIQQHVTIANLNKLPQVSEIIQKNIKTSVEGWSEIVAYGALAEEAVNNKYPMESAIIDCLEKTKTINGADYLLIKEGSFIDR